jgi:6-pyruvoyltetrahydropterin/6-carboxytetrahydropterin synthase
MWELTKSFRFKADHTLSGRHFGAASEEIHGHSFRSEVSLRAMPDPVTGMLVDFGLLQRAIETCGVARPQILNKIEAIGVSTLENPSPFIRERMQHIKGLTRFRIHRDSCNESSTYAVCGR